MKKYFGIVLVLAVTVIFLSGCFYDLVIPESDLNSEDTEDGIVPGKGTLKIYLTNTLEKNGDNSDYENVFISISRIEAYFVETNEEELDTEVADGSKKGNWQVIAEWDGGFEVDLIELGGKSILLASLEQLPSRKYTQLRIFLVEDQAIIVVDGEDYPLPLNIPSVGQTGIKLIHPFEIIPGQITELTLDFDAQQSIIKTGNDEYKLKPVIGIISNYYDQVGGESYLGSIAGLVYGLNGTGGNVVIVGASVKIEGLILPFLETTTTGTGEDGYTINDIPFGVYTVTASYEGYTDAFEPVSIDSGEVVTVNFWLEPEGESE